MSRRLGDIVAGAADDLGAATQAVAHEGGHELLDNLAAEAACEITACDLTARRAEA